MSKKLDVQTSFEAELFRPDSFVEGSAQIASKLRSTISAAIKRSPLSRWQIAGRMGELLDREISKSMIDSWTSDAKDSWRFPAEYIPAFCLAVEDASILDLICSQTKCQLIKNEDLLRLELGRIAAQELMLQERKKTIKREMRG